VSEVGEDAAVVVVGRGRSSLWKIEAVCLALDCSVMNRRWAIAALERPSAISLRTSRLR